MSSAKDLEARLTASNRALTAVTAERDAHAATIGRVRDLLPDLEANIPCDKGNATANRIGQKIRAALDPEPAFVLPTEAGVRFEAQGNDDRVGSLTGFVTLVGAGRPVYMAVDDVDCVYEAEGVIRHYTGHRLIEGAEGA